MNDALEDFILHGDARAVDAWWAEHGMGQQPGKDHDLFDNEVDGEWVAPYSTDRRFRYVIEDRVREARRFMELYAEELYMVVYETRKLERVPVHFFEAMLRATNRQVLLAAARAMGLVAPR